MLDRDLELLRVLRVASMGPRPRGRGCGYAPAFAYFGALASMGPRPRGRGCAASPAPPPSAAPRFNGASSSRTRMHGCSAPAVGAVTLLQWGLVLADEDAHRGSLGEGEGRGASMGPRPRGRGCPQDVARPPGGVVASMGPRPRGRGCGSRRADRAGRPAALQWGLVLADEDANVVNLGAFTLSSLQWGLVLADEDA